MSYTSGLLRDRVLILRREEAKASEWGKMGDGALWVPWRHVWASVGWAKGKGAMNAGAVDVYGVVMVRMRWNDVIDGRCRIRHGQQVYQIIGETFHADRHENTIQFHAQLVVNGK